MPLKVTRDIRRRAFQALYQLDARGGEHTDEIRASLAADSEHADPRALDAAWTLAHGAWENREAADEEMLALAPEWPPSRQAAVDRAILRLSHHEMTLDPPPTPPKVIVNDAIQLAKEFSTDRAPAFINGLLDKVLKRVLGLPPGDEDPAGAVAVDPGGEGPA